MVLFQSPNGLGKLDDEPSDEDSQSFCRLFCFLAQLLKMFCTVHFSDFRRTRIKKCSYNVSPDLSKFFTQSKKKQNTSNLFSQTD